MAIHASLNQTLFRLQTENLLFGMVYVTMFINFSVDSSIEISVVPHPSCSLASSEKEIIKSDTIFSWKLGKTYASKFYQASN